MAFKDFLTSAACRQLVCTLALRSCTTRMPFAALPLGLELEKPIEHALQARLRLVIVNQYSYRCISRYLTCSRRSLFIIHGAVVSMGELRAPAEVVLRHPIAGTLLIGALCRQWIAD